MSTKDPSRDSGLVTVTIDAQHLPGVVYELLRRLSGMAANLDVSGRRNFPDYDLDGIDEFRKDVARMRPYIDLLEQIGWQAEQDATVTMDPAFLQEEFAVMAIDATSVLRQLAAPDGGGFYEPDAARRSFRQTLAGAAHVLEQVAPAEVAQ
jgi:hypothetical protein